MALTANEQAVLNLVAEFDARIKDLTKTRDALLKKVDLTGFEAGDRVATSVGYVRFDSNRRFDKATAQKELSEELYRGICTMQPDLTLAKKILTGDELEACYKDGAPKKVFVKVDDFDE